MTETDEEIGERQTVSTGEEMNYELLSEVFAKNTRMKHIMDCLKENRMDQTRES